MPGLAKTLSVKAMAGTLHAQFARIQFTPDLLPADLLGTMIYNPEERQFTAKKGPIFANLILADEINRAPAKVQSALLEAMQERQVTLGETTYRLPDPFLVLATQNPIDQEGTYQLPEAQLDRFLFKVLVTYPTREEELQSLLDNICRIACEEAGYRMAWWDNRTRRCQECAAGRQSGRRNRLPRTGSPDLVRHRTRGRALLRCGFAPVKSPASMILQQSPELNPGTRRHGSAANGSRIALPPRDEKTLTPLACWGIYSTEAYAFTPEEQRLLEELAGDLAFGIVSLVRVRAERTAAEQRIEHLAFYDPLTGFPIGACCSTACIRPCQAAWTLMYHKPPSMRAIKPTIKAECAFASLHTL